MAVVTVHASTVLTKQYSVLLLKLVLLYYTSYYSWCPAALSLPAVFVSWPGCGTWLKLSLKIVSFCHGRLAVAGVHERRKQQPEEDRQRATPPSSPDTPPRRQMALQYTRVRR